MCKPAAVSLEVEKYLHRKHEEIKLPFCLSTASTIWGVEVELLSFSKLAWSKVSGQLHFPASLPLGKRPR
jgi:hypothetical protein